MTPSQEMLVKAVQLGLADSIGQVGSVFMRIKMSSNVEGFVDCLPQGDWVSPAPPAAALLAEDCTSHGVTGLQQVSGQCLVFKVLCRNM